MGAGISNEKCKNLDEIKAETKTLLTELLDAAKLEPGDALVVGCSSSEVAHHKIGSFSSEEIGNAICETILEVLDGTGIYLAAQCCEHSCV